MQQFWELFKFRDFWVTAEMVFVSLQPLCQEIQRHPATGAGSANIMLPSNGMKQFTACVKGVKGNLAKTWSFHLLKVYLLHVRVKTSLIHCLPCMWLKTDVLMICIWALVSFVCWLGCFSYLFYFEQVTFEVLMEENSFHTEWQALF